MLIVDIEYLAKIFIKIFDLCFIFLFFLNHIIVHQFANYLPLQNIIVQ